MSRALTLNAGSSSLKFGLFEPGAPDPVPLAMGKVERIGAAARMQVQIGAAPERETLLSPEDAADHAGALRAVLNALNEVAGEITAVGHRVVHGGLHYAAPIEIDEAALEELETLIPFAPLHQPHNLAGIRAARTAFPEARQIACFDTAFHRNHPFVNDAFALPRSYFDKGVRRYGFHGLSYDYIAGALAERAPLLASGRVVVAHLGNGASMCGMLDGRSVASTMGFSALDGLPMGTRSGQVDPGVLLYMMQQEGLSPEEIADILYKKSGLLGLSGLSNDMRVLEASDDPKAREALDYFVFRIRRELGGLSAALQGLDALVFTGGIGENSALVRRRVCAGMDWLGIEIDEAANSENAELISTPLSRVQVLVVPTNEELVIARACLS